ncbi:RsmB/NOP family class I SAM-dependent RNA methyltransferase [Paenibacillus sp. Marseille-Q4541]|uniref:RsmF rRNA methyltransferase first C-terminal domain-containing protein n=1 Tax=Paenibacillus sp. Marseille-Q4541 TaxID=2831522 RepID=UPI001BA61A2F|nr:RsmB/NOP family class I SAM-dependent RNA methyltransferase [Paenibacillus sp. Marseille-Q4541]
MALQLPLRFTERMQTMLAEQYEQFVKSYEDLPRSGIRINTLKIDPASFMNITPFELKPIQWCETGYYVPYGTKPGLHPYYHAGLYYIQEPSAMAPAELIDIQPGDYVLDLCAAPGGKSTQMASKLQGKGVLVTNDISTERTKALAKNIEMYGVRNAVVLNEHPDHIAEAFPHYFDKILIDAPCSGEGMFRKDEDMARQWEHHSIERCVRMQRDILSTAASLLAPGGRIVYSTCTFAPEENEAMIGEFLKNHEDFHVLALPEGKGFAGGHPEWIKRMVREHELVDLSIDTFEDEAEIQKQLKKTGRLWPHLIEGEGHFIAVLEHKGIAQKREIGSSHEEAHLSVTVPKGGRKGREEQHALKKQGKGKRSKAGKAEGSKMSRETVSVDPSLVFEQFTRDHLNIALPGTTVYYGDKVYQSPIDPARLKGLRVIRAGWFMGSVKNGRFAPSQALASALFPEEVKRIVHLHTESGEAVRYLKGETIALEESLLLKQNTDSTKGFTLVCIDGYSAGWAKWQEGRLKNEYPAGWRWTSV